MDDSRTRVAPQRSVSPSTTRANEQSIALVASADGSRRSGNFSCVVPQPIMPPMATLAARAPAIRTRLPRRSRRWRSSTARKSNTSLMSLICHDTAQTQKGRPSQPGPVRSTEEICAAQGRQQRGCQLAVEDVAGCTGPEFGFPLRRRREKIAIRPDTAPRIFDRRAGDLLARSQPNAPSPRGAPLHTQGPSKMYRRRDISTATFGGRAATQRSQWPSRGA